MYTYKDWEDTLHFFQELKCIIEGTEAMVFVDKFGLRSDVSSTWRKLYNNYLGRGAKNTLASELENKIQQLK